MHVSSKELLDIQVTIDSGFTLKRVRDMIRTYGTMQMVDWLQMVYKTTNKIWPNSNKTLLRYSDFCFRLAEIRPLLSAGLGID